MKRVIYFTIVACLLSTVAKAQNNSTDILGNYYFTKIVPLTECDVKGNINTTNPQIILSPADDRIVFSVVGITDDKKNVIIVIGNYDVSESNFMAYNYSGSQPKTLKERKQLSKDEREKYDNNLLTQDDGKYQRYFLIALDNFPSIAIKYTRISGGLAAGVINFPFKLRFQRGGGDFSNAFNLGAAIGYKFAHYDYRKFNYSVLAAYSISSVTLDSSSVNNTKNANLLHTSNSFPALSFSVGGLIEYDRVQAGLFFGLDRISQANNATFGWAYQNKPWLSIGFGYSIFSNSKESSKASDNH